MIKAGDYVVHSMEGVCKVKAIVQMPKGREKVSYYQLSSWPDEKTTVYVPVKTDPDKGVRLRKILSKDEIVSSKRTYFPFIPKNCSPTKNG
mgnify:CR=1 FL=1